MSHYDVYAKIYAKNSRCRVCCRTEATAKAQKTRDMAAGRGDSEEEGQPDYGFIAPTWAPLSASTEWEER